MRPTTIAVTLGLSFIAGPVHAVQNPSPAYRIGSTETAPQVTLEYNAFQGVKHSKGVTYGGTSATVRTSAGTVRVDRGWSNAAPPAPAATTQVAIDFMLSKVGNTPYQAGGTGNPGYDCSGLTQAAWRAAGKTLPRTSEAQFAATARIALSELKPGDLLFYGPGGSWHVAVYMGGSRLVHAANPSDDIEVSDMTYAWYAMNFYGAGRVI